MALYEVVREIQNSCSRNQMRDVFFEEIETDDPLEAVRGMLANENVTDLYIDVKDDENCTVYATCSGVNSRFLFTKI